jgi:hypothetical protein
MAENDFSRALNCAAVTLRKKIVESDPSGNYAGERDEYIDAYYVDDRGVAAAVIADFLQKIGKPDLADLVLREAKP